MSKWTPDNETKLLLIMVAHYYTPRNASIRWEAVAALMGDNFTAGGVSQRFSKNLAKKEVFVEAKKVFGRWDPPSENRNSMPNTPSKKRKMFDDLELLKKEEDEY
jgi:hypothetical protein